MELNGGVYVVVPTGFASFVVLLAPRKLLTTFGRIWEFRFLGVWNLEIIRSISLTSISLRVRSFLRTRWLERSDVRQGEICIPLNFQKLTLIFVVFVLFWSVWDPTTFPTTPDHPNKLLNDTFYGGGWGSGTSLATLSAASDILLNKMERKKFLI